MASLPTVEIHNPKDHSMKWIINEADFDPSQHSLWGESLIGGSSTPPSGVTEQENPPSPALEPEHTTMRPSVPDFVDDADGNIVAVNVINPVQRTSRLEIPYQDYDPDKHELWSSHPRFR